MADNGANSLAQGLGAESLAANSVALGRNAAVGAQNTGSVAIGSSATIPDNGNGGESVAVGESATASAWRATVLGYKARVKVVSGTAIGRGAITEKAHDIAVGRGAWTPATGNNGGMLALGFNGGDSPTHVYFESGHTHKYVEEINSGTITRNPSLTPIVIHGFDAYDATVAPTNDVAGGDLKLAAGVGTGTANSGKVILQYAAAGGVSNNTKNALVDGFTLHNNGDVECHKAGAGLILKSPNGTRYRLKVGNDGSLSTEVV
jgi:trimeric autotransporter adhesin